MNSFDRLSPFIREYIYKNKWESLNDIQNKACQAIFETNSHIIISAGTASGKTEAAFLPALTVIEEEKPSSVGILYIAPMKALLNDQFYRLEGLLAEADIPVTCWHGDVLQSKKDKLIKNPNGVLQITPESLESLVINKSRDLVRIFGDLRFIIIDEIHSFMGTDRGIQVMCLIQRIQKYIRTTPRRIGLSATLGDYDAACSYLKSGTDNDCIIITGEGYPRKIRLSLEHYTAPIIETDMSPFEDEAWIYLYEKSLGKKCIIFANGRETADGVIANMKYMAAINNMPDIYHVHHGSIAAALREDAETTMKTSQGPVVIGATVTLEMGIDIGSLERVIQIGPPVSVTSLVQRLGRSGRRGNIPEMMFTDWENPSEETSPIPHKIPWRMIQIIAMLQLYLEEKWIEPPKILKYPLNMLYHQIMSAVAEAGELSLPSLVGRVLSLENFKNISLDDFSDLVFSLIDQNHLEMTEEGGIIIGLEGEKIINTYKFYAVFPEEEEWAVMEGSKKLGTIEFPVPPSKYLTIAGETWIVRAVDNNKRLVFVEKTKRKIQLLWMGDRALTHDRILKRMRQVLFEDTKYPYLQEKAQSRLNFAREIARECNLDKTNIIELDGGKICLIPWLGHINFHIISEVIRKYMAKANDDRLTARVIGGMRPYFITIKTDMTGDEFVARMKEIINSGITPSDIPDEAAIRQFKKQCEYKTPKYDGFIPLSLLKKQVLEDYIDLNYLRKEINGWE
jgi:ATP-dependent Lhr-like helicase